jgi:hypothetical protein
MMMMMMVVMIMAYGLATIQMLMSLHVVLMDAGLPESSIT